MPADAVMYARLLTPAGMKEVERRGARRLHRGYIPLLQPLSFTRDSLRVVVVGEDKEGGGATNGSVGEGGGLSLCVPVGLTRAPATC